jgi:hypothetical protein
MLDIIIGCVVRFINYLQITRQITSFVPFDTSWIIYNYELSLWHSLRLNLQLQLPIELIHNLNKNFIPHEIHVAITTLSHYLFKSLCCFKFILSLQCLKIILSSLDPSLTPFQLFHEFQTFLLTWLPIKYQNKINVLPNIMNFGVCF